MIPFFSEQLSKLSSKTISKSNDFAQITIEQSLENKKTRFTQKQEDSNMAKKKQTVTKIGYIVTIQNRRKEKKDFEKNKGYRCVWHALPTFYKAIIPVNLKMTLLNFQSKFCL